MREEYIIFKRTIANELLERGFEIKRIEENHYDKKKSIFVFKTTQELIDYMQEIKKRKK